MRRWLIALLFALGVVGVILASFEFTGNLTGQAGMSALFTRSGMLHLIGAVTVIGLLIAVGSIYYYEKQKQEEERLEAERQEAMRRREQRRKEESLIQDEDPSEDPVGKLWDYVDNELRHGMSREEIVQHLRERKWPDNVITNIVDTFRDDYMRKRGMRPHDDEARLEEFIRSHRASGYPLGVIRWNLLNAGWDAGVVDRAVESVEPHARDALAPLRAYIAGERHKGTPPGHIRQLLLNRGWRAETVDAELRKW